MSLSTPQGRAAAVIGAVGGYGIRRLRYEMGSTSRKRARLMSSVKKSTRRAVSRGKQNQAVPVGARVGPFLGSIAATKPVKLVKGSTLYRVVKHGQVAAAAGTRSVWYGGSSLGPRSKTFDVVADAFICHYLKRIKDHRSSRSQAPSATYAYRIFKEFRIVFGRPGQAPGNEPEWALTNDTINNMVSVLSAKLQETWIDRNLVPVGLIITRQNTQEDAQIFRDDFVYKNVFTFDCKSNFKVNNTTLANTGNDSNVNAVDANPVDGRIYTFRNRVPVFSPSYLVSLDSTLRGNITDISAIDADYETGVHYGPLNVTTLPGELTAPPLRPAVLFKNAKTSTKVNFAPGGFKMFSMRYSKEATLYAFLKAVMPIDSIGGDGLEVTPPGGDSFLMCLKPTIRTGTNNDMKLLTQAEFVYKCNMKAGKPAKLPTVQELE